MQRLKYFSGIKPTVEDFEFEQAGTEQAILDRQQEMFTDGVVAGFELIDTGGAYTLMPGLAYIGGERITLTVGVNILIPPSELPAFLFLKHSLTASHPVQHFVTGEEHHIYQTDGYAPVVKHVPKASDGELLLTEITETGIIDRRVFVGLSVDDRMHAPNSDSGTSAPEFRVGIGDPQHPTGLKVITESPVPQPPVHLRITSITPDRRDNMSGIDTPTLSSNIYRANGLARVSFAWDYRDIVGIAVGSGTFRIENAGYHFSEDELEGYYLHLTDGFEVQVNGNQPTSGGTTLLSVDGDITGRVAHESPAWLHPGATDYHYSAWPVVMTPTTPRLTDAAAIPTTLSLLPVAVAERLEGTIRAHPAASEFSLSLPLGTFWALQMQSIRSGMSSEPRLMGAGSYTKNGQQIGYSYPFLVALPDIGGANLNLSAHEDGKGFTATIIGWDEAEAFEYGWIRSQGLEVETVDLDDPAHHSGITSGHNITIAVWEDYMEVVARPTYVDWMVNIGNGGIAQPPQPVSRSYLFAVRPLIAGQVVGETVSQRITLTIEPDRGQKAVVAAIGTMTRHIDALNKQLRNMDAVRQAQSGMIEDQLLTLNSQLTEGQHYARFDLTANVTLPFAGLGEIPLLSGADGTGSASMTFTLYPSLLEQAFTHDLGHTNYVVQVRDEEGNVVTADVTLETNRVIVRLAESMAGSVIILY